MICSGDEIVSSQTLLVKSDNRGSCKTFAIADGTEPVPPQSPVSHGICAFMGGPRSVAAGFCNCLNTLPQYNPQDFHKTRT